MTRAQLRTIGFFMRPYALLYGAIVLVSLVASVFESVNLAAFFPVFSALSGAAADQAPVPGVMAVLQAMSRLVPLPDPVTAACVLLVATVLIKVALVLLRERLIAHTSGFVVYDLKNRMLSRYGHSRYETLLDTHQGVLLYNCLTGPDKVALLLLRAPQLVAELLKLIALALVLLSAWPMAMGVLGVLTLLYNQLTHALARKVSYNVGSARATAGAQQMTIANEFFDGIRHLLAYAVIQPWLARFERANRQFRDLFIRDLWWLTVPLNLMEATAVFVLAGLLIVARTQSPAQFAAGLPLMGVFAIGVLRLLHALTSFGRLRMEMLGALPDAERIRDVLAGPLSERPLGRRPFTSLEQEIRFEGVSFSHQGRQPLLQALTVRFARGQITAIVGASGAGKSTLVNLLLGLFVPSQGQILVDGIPLSTYRLETWLKQIGFVSQDPFIYHATVADNILFGRSGYCQEDMIRAARIAHAHEFILELPSGYDTVVGERGMKLSGGQQQRLAIARAMLDDPQILLLDEATSHLDAPAEKHVQGALEEIAKDHTVILIAHRLSTIRQAHKIVVLDRGRIVEEGSHEQLLSGQGRYVELVASAAG